MKVQERLKAAGIESMRLYTRAGVWYSEAIGVFGITEAIGTGADVNEAFEEMVFDYCSRKTQRQGA